MASNRGVAYIKPGTVEVHDNRVSQTGTCATGPESTRRTSARKCEHGVIMKVVSTNICGSDQHMVRGRNDRAGRSGPRARDHR